MKNKWDFSSIKFKKCVTICRAPGIECQVSDSSLIKNSSVKCTLVASYKYDIKFSETAPNFKGRS